MRKLVHTFFSNRDLWIPLRIECVFSMQLSTLSSSLRDSFIMDCRAMPDPELEALFSEELPFILQVGESSSPRNLREREWHNFWGNWMASVPEAPRSILIVDICDSRLLAMISGTDRKVLSNRSKVRPSFNPARCLLTFQFCCNLWMRSVSTS